MKKFLAAFALVLSGIAVPTTIATAPASAEPGYDTWYCRDYDQFTPLLRSQFYGCPMGTIFVLSGYTGEQKYKLNGYCANQLWNRNRNATWANAVQQCKI